MRRHVAIVMGALIIGLLVGLALLRWEGALDRVDLGALKRRFVTEARIEQAHNDVYVQVGGEQVWEAHAKPWFLREVTKRAAIDAGTPFPTQEEIIDWARTHPDDVKELLRETGARFERVTP